MKKLNKRSCMLDSFIAAINYTADSDRINHSEAAHWLGHDGSERGFHSQEMIDLCLEHDIAVIEIVRNPVGVRPDTYQQIPIFQTPDWRFFEHMEGRAGVLMGYKHNAQPHAVFWDGEEYTDPADGLTRTLDDNHFTPHTFLRTEDVFNNH